MRPLIFGLVLTSRLARFGEMSRADGRAVLVAYSRVRRKNTGLSSRDLRAARRRKRPRLSPAWKRVSAAICTDVMYRCRCGRGGVQFSQFVLFKEQYRLNAIIYFDMARSSGGEPRFLRDEVWRASAWDSFVGNKVCA